MLKVVKAAFLKRAPAMVVKPDSPMAAPPPAIAEPVKTPTALPIDAKRVKEIETDAYNAGFKQGYNDGRTRAEQLLLRINTLLTSIRDEFDGHLARFDEPLTDLVAVAITRIADDWSGDREKMLAVVRQALREHGQRTVLNLYLAVEDYDFVMATGLRFPESEVLKVAPSAKVTLGGCLIETAAGLIDARLEQQIDRVSQLLSSAHHAKS